MFTKSLTLGWVDMLPEGLPWSMKQLIVYLAQLKLGTLVLRMQDKPAFVIEAGQPGPGAELHIRNPFRMLQRLFWRGDIGFAESYIAGEWDTPDLTPLLYLLCRNLDVLQKGKARHPLLRGLIALQLQ